MPPKSKRPVVPTDSFLFVNEDFSTLFGGARNADLDRSKQSHVQRQSFAKRRRSRRQDLAATAQILTPSEEAESPAQEGFLLPFPISNSLWMPETLDESSHQLVSTTQSSLFDATTTPQWEQPAADFSDQGQYNHVRWSLPDQTLPSLRPPRPSALDIPLTTDALAELDDTFSISPLGSASQTDPFNNIQLALEKWAPPLMQYFTLTMIPELFYTDLRVIPLQNMRHVEYLHEDMRSCMMNPAEMYALLAASSSHALSRQGTIDLPGLAPEDSNRVTLLFKSKALEALRLRLSNEEPNQGLVIAIQRMICATHYLNNDAGIDPHYRASLSMIQTLGGLNRFNDYQMERLIMHDLSYALRHGCSPLTELSWDPGNLLDGVDFDSVVQMKQTRSDTGEAIAPVVRDPQIMLPPVVAGCMSELVEAQRFSEWLHERDYQPQHYRWLCLRRLAMVHRLLMIDETMPVNPWEAVRFALLYYCIMLRVIPYHNNVLLDQCVLRVINNWDIDEMLHTFRQYMNLLLWVIVMFSIGKSRDTRVHGTSEHGIVSASSNIKNAPRPGSGDESNPHIFGLIARTGEKVCEVLGITTESELRRLMKRFLFSDDFADDNYMAFVSRELKLD